jgi:ParB-like chromosome segregation protein Spo0J
MSNVEVVSALVMVDTKTIKPYFRNPRLNEKTVARLVELIPKVGFNVPLVLDRDNVIVKGHARWTAAIQLGMPELPCVYTDADAETIRVDRLTDNRVAEFSDWEEELLKAELTMVTSNDLGALLQNLEFELTDEAGPMSPHQPASRPPSEPGPGGSINDYYEVTCNKCGNTMFVPKAGRAA